MSLVYLVVMLALGQGVFLAFCIVTRNKKAGIVPYVVSFLLLIEILVIYDSVYLQFNSALPWQLYLYGTMFVPLIGPLLLLVARLTSESQFQFRWYHVLHIIPFLFFFVFFLDQYFLLHSYDKLVFIERSQAFAQTINPTYSMKTMIVNESMRLHIIVYSALALRGTFSSFDRSGSHGLSSVFLKTLSLGALTVATLDFLLGVVTWTTEFTLTISSFLLLIIFSIHLFVLNRMFFLGRKKEEKVQGKYAKSGLKSDESARCLRELKALMEEGVYRDPLLTLPRLAKSVNTNAHYLSQVINKELGKSYHELIKEYRNNLAGELLMSEEWADEPVNQIGEACGFVSKSNFYRSFKSQFGVSPGSYRKMRELELVS